MLLYLVYLILNIIFSVLPIEPVEFEKITGQSSRLEENLPVILEESIEYTSF